MADIKKNKGEFLLPSPIFSTEDNKALEEKIVNQLKLLQISTLCIEDANPPPIKFERQQKARQRAAKQILSLITESAPKDSKEAVYKILEDRFKSPAEGAGLVWDRNFAYMAASDICKVSQSAPTSDLTERVALTETMLNAKDVAITDIKSLLDMWRKEALLLREKLSAPASLEEILDNVSEDFAEIVWNFYVPDEANKQRAVELWLLVRKHTMANLLTYIAAEKEAARKEVVEWVNSHIYMNKLYPKVWQTQCKEWGIKPGVKPKKELQGE